MIDLLRLMRAVHLDTQPQGGGLWQVTGPESFHLVNVGDSELLCDCRDFAIRGGPCKHILRVGLANGDCDTIKALRRLLPIPSRRSARRRTSRPHPEVPNSFGPAPESRQTGAQVALGATNADDRRGRVA